MLVMEHEFAGQMFRHVQKWHSACAVGAVGPWPSGRMERTSSVDYLIVGHNRAALRGHAGCKRTI